jgi:uncharacterized protein YggE
MNRLGCRALVGLVAGLLLPSAARAQITIVPDPARTIYVAGRGVVSVVPDTAEVTLGVAVRDVELKKAKTTVDSAMQRMIAVAEHLGIVPADMRTSSMNVAPQYGDDASRRFLGYDVTRSVTVTVRDLAKLEPLLDGAIDAGANREFDVSLSSSRFAQLKQEALSKAIADCRAQAEFAAAKLGLRVGAVRSASLTKASGGFASAYVTSGPRFLPGQITVDAEAAVTFILDEAEARK